MLLKLGLATFSKIVCYDSKQLVRKYSNSVFFSTKEDKAGVRIKNVKCDYLSQKGLILFLVMLTDM